jgi:hypothetical protein
MRSAGVSWCVHTVPMSRFARPAGALMSLVLLLGACGESDRETGERTETIAATATWQWQLQGDINIGYDVDVYDIDLFDAPSSIIEQLRSEGRTVICYFSAGSFEQWRDDAVRFPAQAIGNTLDGWDDERWVDTRDAAVRDVLAARLDLAVERGCHGVEPDNVTAFQNDSGFDLTADDQLDFNRFLADAAHRRGLLIGLKNDLLQIPDLVDAFDFAVNEECLQYDECDAFTPFVEAGKAVLNAEYDESAVGDPASTCAAAEAAGLQTLILPVELDDSMRISC